MESKFDNTNKTPPAHETDSEEIPEDNYAKMARKVDAVYDAIGARVIYGVSYAGEDPVQLYVPPEQSSYPNYPT